MLVIIHVGVGVYPVFVCDSICYEHSNYKINIRFSLLAY